MNDLEFLELLAKEQDKESNVHAAKRIRNITEKIKELKEENKELLNTIYTHQCM